MSRVTFTEAELSFLAGSRVARLATADGSGQPHVIPIVFAVDGQKLYSPIDKKPKRVAADKLKRVRNLTLNPRVSIVVDEYDEDWSRLAWVLIRGTGEIVESGMAHTVGIRLLHDKYSQYSAMPLEHQPLIVITPEQVTNWGKRFSG